MLHRKSTFAFTALLTGALLSATAPAATASVETCQGRLATIVGTGPEVAGTPGDDVIVAGSSTVIRADAGNDLVCVANSSSFVKVEAGHGDDVVDTTATTSQTWAQLGSGVDRYLGGSGADTVDADDADDEVLTGDGNDSTRLRIMSAPGAIQGRYDGGSGANHVTVHSARSPLDVSLNGEVLVDGVAAADLANFQDGSAAALRVVLRGTGEDNRLAVTGCDLRVYGGGGDDTMGRSHLWYPGAPALPQCEDRLRSFGGAGDDNLRAGTDYDRLSGGAGDDVLTSDNDPNVLLGGPGSDRITGGLGSDVLKGHRGADLLEGGYGNDTILGGQGSDKAFGEAGRDRCVAEVERDCEKRK